MAAIYDLIIIGAGPAGITASVYAARKKMNFLVITDDIGGQAAWSGEIQNYTGYQFISGPDLVSKFEEHLRQYAISVRENEKVTSLQKAGDIIEITTGRSGYQARTVIIASGKKSRELGVPGEREFKNRGLTYCATCDGPLFAHKDVAVIGGGNSALDASLQLVRIARHVSIINNTPALGGDAAMREKVLVHENLTVYNDANVTAIKGAQMVDALVFEQDGRPAEIAVQGIFIEIGLEPNADFVAGVSRNSVGEIQVDCQNHTSVPGIFAAGDVTDVADKQIIIAAGDGAKAALGAFRYLAQHRF